MPELVSDSSSLPDVPPDDWERLPAFRETFLMYVTPPGYAAALQTMGEMLYSLILDAPAEWAGWPESATRTELRAAGADLRHLQGFLRSVEKEREVSSLDAEDAYLALMAGKLSHKLGRMAGWIEKELAGAKP